MFVGSLAVVGPRLSQIVSEAPSLVPFVAPEALEARRGKPFELRLGANESAFGPSPKALEAIGAINPAHYGDPQSLALREAIAGREGVAVGNVLVASGIDETLSLFCRAFLNPGEVAVTSLGSYPTFDFAAPAAGARLVRVPYQNDRPDLASLAEAARREHGGLVYLANPDNPSGVFQPLDGFVESLPAKCLLLLDEAYFDFVPPSRRPVLPDDPRIVRTRTFSKAHGLAGLRIGYALASGEYVSALDRIRLHFGVNAAAQAAALASLNDPGHVEGVIDETNRQRMRLIEIGRENGLIPLPSSTNFVTFATESRERAEGLLEALLRVGVFVRKPGQPPLDRAVRITVGRAADMDRLAELLPLALKRE